jgi:hypothetical protein
LAPLKCLAQVPGRLVGRVNRLERVAFNPIHAPLTAILREGGGSRATPEIPACAGMTENAALVQIKPDMV